MRRGRRAVSRGVAARAASRGGVLLVALLGLAPAAAEPPAPEPEPPPAARTLSERYQTLPRGSGEAWRLDTVTGQLCLFDYSSARIGYAVVNAGCSPESPPPPGAAVKRFQLMPRPGGEVWRVDTATGQMCVFEYSTNRPTSPVGNIGCSELERGEEGW